MNVDYLPLISAVAVAIIGSMMAPWALQRLKGAQDLDLAERQEWRQERRDMDAARRTETQSLKLENRTLHEAYDDLDRRCTGMERNVETLTTRVGQQEVVIAKQVEKLNGKDTEIETLKARVASLEGELLVAYREIEKLRRRQDAAK